MIDDLLVDAGRRMDKSVEAAAHEFNTVRTGRASSALLDRIQIDYYGQKTPLQQLATVNVPGVPWKRSGPASGGASSGGEPQIGQRPLTTPAMYTPRSR